MDPKDFLGGVRKAGYAPGRSRRRDRTMARPLYSRHATLAGVWRLLDHKQKHTTDEGFNRLGVIPLAFDS